MMERLTADGASNWTRYPSRYMVGKTGCRNLAEWFSPKLLSDAIVPLFPILQSLFFSLNYFTLGLSAPSVFEE